MPAGPNVSSLVCTATSTHGKLDWPSDEGVMKVRECGNDVPGATGEFPRIFNDPISATNSPLTGRPKLWLDSVGRHTSNPFSHLQKMSQNRDLSFPFISNSVQLTSHIVNVRPPKHYLVARPVTNPPSPSLTASWLYFRRGIQEIGSSINLLSCT